MDAHVNYAIRECSAMEIVENVVELKSFEVRNPLNNDLLRVIRSDNRMSVQRAISRLEQYDYRLTGWERYEILKRLCSLLESNRSALKQMISLESGKTLHDADLEVSRAYQAFLLSAEEAKRINGELVPLDSVAGMDKGIAMVTREPVGIVAAITPFNFPLNLVAHKVGPALAANNPVIVKPSESTPITAFRLRELLCEAGLPEEMMQIVVGDPEEIVDVFCSDDRVSRISFTGSTNIGKSICRKAGLKGISMELGGNDPMVILSDADLEKALPIAIDGAYGNNGERCTAVKRFVIEDCIADEFIDMFSEATGRLRVGDQLDPTINIGPLINTRAAKTVEKRINETVKDGAELRCGGKRQGALLWPTVLDYVHNSSPVVKVETFGPVAPFIRVENFDHAIDVVNESDYGLQSGVFTNDLGKAKAAAQRIRAGGVMINRPPGFRAEHLPFGGIKNSGIGREGIKYAVESMTHSKTIVM